MTESMTQFLMTITNIGDSGLLTVLGCMAGLYLYAVGDRTAGNAVSWSLVICIAIMAALKLAFRSCGGVLPSIDVVSPSGHAALSATVMGSICVVVSCHIGGWRRAASIALAVFLIATIAASRVILNYHTLNEVLIGLVVGLVITGCAYLYLRKTPRTVFKTRYLAAILSAGLLLFYGASTPAEGLIVKLAELLKASLPFCQA